MMVLSKPFRYYLLSRSLGGSSETSKERLLKPDEYNSDVADLSPPVHRRIRLGALLCSALNVAFLLLTGTLLVLEQRRKDLTIKRAVELTTLYSPVLKDITPLFKDVQFNGTLFPPAEPGLGRLEPGPTTDALYDDFEVIRMLVLTREDILSIGKDPATVARYPDSPWHFGPDAYIGNLYVFHQIHCLNELRKKAFEDYPGPDGSSSGHRTKTMDELGWIHLRHCTDMLLQAIMCHADMEIITMQWADTQPWAFPDMSINKKCRDFQQLVAWRDEHAVDSDLYKKMRTPEDVPLVPMEKAYYDMYGYTHSSLFPDGRQESKD